jgi:hypothetical protein
MESFVDYRVFKRRFRGLPKTKRVTLHGHDSITTNSFPFKLSELSREEAKECYP